MLTYTQMLQFLSVVRNQSISKAADELFVSQSSISINLKKIEAELGIDLFIYSNKEKKLHLTNDGHIAYNLIVNILNGYNDLQAFSDEHTTTYSTKSFHFFAPETIHTWLTPNLPIYESFPYHYFSTHLCNSLDDFFAEISTRNDTFGLFFIPSTIYDIYEYKFRDFSFENLASYTACVRTSYKNKHPITNKKSITCKELETLPLIRCAASNHALTEHILDSNLSFLAETANAKLTNQMLDKKTDFFVLGINIFRHNFNEKLVSIPIEDAPETYLVFISKKDSAESQEIIPRIIQMIKSII